jgi:hypothetical protein
MRSMVSDAKTKSVESVITSLPDSIDWNEIVCLITVIISKYGAEEHWAEISTDVTVTLADLDRGDSPLN